MASQTLTSIVGSGGGFVAKFSSLSVNIPIGVTGDIATLTPPAGQKVRLTSLFCGPTDSQAGISVDIGGSNVVPIGTVVGFQTPQNSSGSGILVGGQLTPFIDGEPDQAMVIRKDAGNTAKPITYAYQFGV